MNRFRSSFCFLFLVSCFFITSPTLAKNCNLPRDQIDYPGPYSVVLESSRIEDDCSYPEDASILDMDVILHGRFTSQLVDLKAVLHGNPELLNPNGNGTLNISLEDLSTFGIGGNLLTDPNTAGSLLKYRKVIEAYKDYDITHIYREAYADGVFSFDDFETWACDRDLCICNGDDCHINPSIYSSASQLTPLKDQLTELLGIAQAIVYCSDSTYADTHPCSTFYPLPDGQNSLDVARIVIGLLDPGNLVESWSNLTDKQKFQAYSLHLTQSAPTFILIVPRETECNDDPLTCFISQIVGIFINTNEQPGYIKAVIPETRNLKRGVAAHNARLTPLRDQQQAALNPPQLYAAANRTTDATTTSTYGPNDSLFDILLEEAATRDPDCENPPPSLTENLGASSTPVKNQAAWNIPYGFSYSTAEGSSSPVQNQEDLYCVYIWSPPDLVDADNMLGADEDAALRKLLPLNTAGFEVGIDAPQNLPSSGNAQTFNNGICLRYAINPDTYEEECVEREDNYVSYHSTAKLSQPAGKLPVNRKIINFGLAAPLNSTTNIQDSSQCLVPWLAAGAQADGFDLNTAINANSYSESTCPNPITPLLSHSGLSETDVCVIAETYNVDCLVLLGVWEVESSGASLCVPNCWSDPSQCTISPECISSAHCDDPASTYAQGPLGIATNMAAVDPSLDRCHLPDALGLAAQILVELKNFGNPVTVADLEPTGRYQGCNNCEPSDQTQYRWGEGVSYCDAVQSFIDSGQLPPDNTSYQFDPSGIQCYP